MKREEQGSMMMRYSGFSSNVMMQKGDEEVKLGRLVECEYS